MSNKDDNHVHPETRTTLICCLPMFSLSPSLKTIVKSKVGSLTCSSSVVIGQLGTVAAIEDLYRIPLHARHFSRSVGQTDVRSVHLHRLRVTQASRLLRKCRMHARLNKTSRPHSVTSSSLLKTRRSVKIHQRNAFVEQSNRHKGVLQSGHDKVRRHEVR
jgi:hypothetical protein